MDSGQHRQERAKRSGESVAWLLGELALLRSCAGCELDLFSSATKYDSRTGWPSFWAPLEHAVGTTRDTTFGMVRTAVHCSRGGGHLGHVFDDGPPPTGQRYCMNGVSLDFHAGEKPPAADAPEPGEAR